MRTMALLVLAALTMSVGCTEFGYIASKNETFSGADTMELPGPHDNILDLVASVGKSMGYSVSGLDKSQRRISLSSSASMMAGLMIGKMSSSTLTITVSEDGRKLGIQVDDGGNFGSGGQEAADKQIAEFKARLTKTL